MNSRLREERHKQGFTIRQLASMASISARSLQSAELTLGTATPMPRPRYRTRRNILKALHIPWKWHLYYFEGKPAPIWKVKR